MKGNKMQISQERMKILYDNMLDHISELVSGSDLVDTLRAIGFTDREIIAEGFTLEEPIRYYVCGIGYDKNDCVTDREWSFGDFDTYEEAYDLFVKTQCQNAETFFTEKDSNVHTMLLQLEKCKETDDGTECVDVINEWSVQNPFIK